MLDGFGIAPESEENLLSKKILPNFYFFSKEYPATTLYSAGRQIGSSDDEKGNSIAGHLNIGAGRLCYSTREKIDRAITDKTFFENKILLKSIEFLQKNNSNLHLAGFLGIDKQFSDEKHLLSLLEFYKNVSKKKIFLHIFLDTENTMDENNKKILENFLAKIKNNHNVILASLSGKNFAMDMDRHWDRTEKVYKTICNSSDIESFDLKDILADFSLLEKSPIKIKHVQYNFNKNDLIFFFNHSSVGMRQLTKAFALPSFTKFPIIFDHLENLVITLTEYDKELPALVAFPKFFIYNSLTEMLSKNKFKQLHLAGPEKFSHATYYFNGKINDAFENETDEMVKLSITGDYNEYLRKITKTTTNKIIKNINNDNFDFYLVNYSILDLTADFVFDKEKIKKNVLLLDKQIKKIADYCLAKDGTLFISSSYVKRELLGINVVETVPFLIIKNSLRGKKIVKNDSINGDLSLVYPTGNLADIAPTILTELQIEIPKEMTGKSLLN